MKYLKDNDLLPDLQSAYRAMHSTETAVLKVLADILLALDSGDLAMLTLLDLSAAFDSVNHDTLPKLTEPAAKVLQSWRAGAKLVRLIVVWSCSTRTHIGGLFYTVSGSTVLRSTAGIGSHHHHHN